MREALLAYCSVRVLADHLAAAGYATLRFDYPAAGNSLDADLNQGGAHWSASVAPPRRASPTVPRPISRAAMRAPSTFSPTAHRTSKLSPPNSAPTARA
jgi:hypothetical protein